MSLFDLHSHSTASDGALSPTELVELAHDRGLSTLALTDHDTIAGVAEAAARGATLGVTVIPGIEVSCAHPRPGTLHLLGYGFDPTHPAMRTLLDHVESARHERAELIVRRLNALGIPLTAADVRAHAGPVAAPGRPHLAAALVAGGHAASSRDAFDRLLGTGGSAWVDNLPLGPGRVIELLRAAGGLVSLAHPLQLRRRSFAEIAAFVQDLTDQGLNALETHHPTHDAETGAKFTRLADRLGLTPTGGSDFHSPVRHSLGHTGGVPLPGRLYEEFARGVRAAGGAVVRA